MDIAFYMYYTIVPYICSVNSWAERVDAQTGVSHKHFPNLEYCGAGARMRYA